MRKRLTIGGYLLALAPMGLLVLGVAIHVPWFVFTFFFGVLPLVRLLLPDDIGIPPGDEEISPAQLRLLNAVPWMHTVLWMLVLPWSMYEARVLPSGQLIGFALSCWVVTSLNLTVAHELLHSPVALNRIAARFMAGSIGYFQMVEEHWHHHAIAGSAETGDSAQPGESVFSYALRRYAGSFSVAWQWGCRGRASGNRAHRLHPVLSTALITVGVATLFAAIAGMRGVAFYCAIVAGTAFTMQAITYIQHWGLTDHVSPSLSAIGYSWEDRCVMQAWITLNHAYHGLHHRRPRLPYYLLGGFPDSPKLPASYAVMMLAALVPPLFERVMQRRLRAWRDGTPLDAPAHRRPCGGGGRLFDR